MKVVLSERPIYSGGHSNWSNDSSERFVQNKADDAGGIGFHQRGQRSYGQNGQARNDQFE
jgi:hypothetical protein